MQLAREIARLDIGQSLLMRGDTVACVEAYKGTNECIRNAGKPPITLCKVTKPGHDMRFDVPCIGLRTVQHCSASGVNHIVFEARRTILFQRQAVIDHCNAHGITLHAMHLPFGPFTELDPSAPALAEQTIAYFSGLMAQGAAIGVPMFVLHASGEPIREERALRMETAKKSLARLADMAAAHGAVIAVENLPRTCLGRTADEVAELVAADPRLRVCFDVNHLCLEYGCDHREFVEKLGHLIETTHMSDYDFVDEKHFFPGNGQIDWQEVISLLEDAGYCGPFLAEGGFEPSRWAPEVPFGKVEDLHDRHMHIKEFRGKNA
jgi:sugar phosphate isomerase/epimerase